MIKTGSPTKYLMIQGTGSHVGKSVITAALCRIFSNQGYHVAPFKAQNMSLNSAVTADGCEVGRSTALQATAARTDLRVEMNPVLIKPKSENIAQVILNGSPYDDVSAVDSFGNNKKLKDLKTDIIHSSLKKLSKDYDFIIIEGAGSPAEVNLRDYDVVNMDVALYLKAPVVIVADIEPGGVIAALVGTHVVLPQKEAGQIKAFLINKFRGERSLLDPALSIIHKKTGWFSAGVVPFSHSLKLEEEDRLPGYSFGSPEADIDIVIINHRHLSNFTDLDPLTLEPGVRLRYVSRSSEIGEPDCIILPGSKNTISDLLTHNASGISAAILRRVQRGSYILGICAGYQMLGKTIYDPNYYESNIKKITGLGLLNVSTEFKAGKVTKLVKLLPVFPGIVGDFGDFIISGYEIHSGVTHHLHSKVKPFMMTSITREKEGAVSETGRIFGTSVHGIFENDRFRRNFINLLRENKDIPLLSSPMESFLNKKDLELENWASLVNDHLEDEFFSLVSKGL